MKTKEHILIEIAKLGFILQSAGYANEQEAEKGHYQWQYLTLPMDNHKLQNSPFYYLKGKDFIHFTGVEGFYGMLNSKHIRLYNLVNMDDKHELTYALNELSFPENDEVIKNKEEIFCLSMCSFPEIDADEAKEHLLWKLYGKDGNGVMIRLHFENNYQQWYQYHISQVYYDLATAAPIKELHAVAPEIFLDPKVSCFFKRPIFKFEEEVRLIFDKREKVSVTVTDNKSKVVYPITYPDKLSNNANIRYFQLPLGNFHDGTPDFYHAPNMVNRNYEIPIIKIREIILGYRFSENQEESIRKRLKEIDTTIEVRRTKLSAYY